jgi:hypothetical protein
MTAPEPGPAPAAPGALGRPPMAREVLDYLAAMNTWTTRLRTALDEVDARARLGAVDPVLTADVTLAYAVSQSIATRVGEIERVWDSGRVARAELEEIGRLLWTRLDDGSGGLSVSLTEACVLGEALLTRLAQRLASDPERSGAALRARSVREALAHCREMASELQRADATERATRVERDLDKAVALTNDAAARAAVARADADASALERELILAGAARVSLARERDALDTRLRAAVARAAQVHDVASRCAAAVVRPPVLAVPDPARLGPVPEDALDAYAVRLGRVEAALREAAERYTAPLAELAELQGLLDAYRAKATAHGLDDPALVAEYDAAHALLADRPCDLAAARERVASYRRGVDTGKDAPTRREPTTVPREGGER